MRKQDKRGGKPGNVTPESGQNRVEVAAPNGANPLQMRRQTRAGGSGVLVSQLESKTDSSPVLGS